MTASVVPYECMHAHHAHDRHIDTHARTGRRTRRMQYVYHMYAAATAAASVSVTACHWKQVNAHWRVPLNNHWIRIMPRNFHDDFRGVDLSRAVLKVMVMMVILMMMPELMAMTIVYASNGNNDHTNDHGREARRGRRPSACTPRRLAWQCFSGEPRVSHH